MEGDTPARREESEQELEERRAKELAALDAKLEELSAEVLPSSFRVSEPVSVPVLVSLPVPASLCQAAKYASEIDSFYSNLRQVPSPLMFLDSNLC